MRPLCIKFPKMTDNARNNVFSMSFRVNNKQILKNYNKVWEKIEKLMEIYFERKPIYGDDDKYI